ncbi:uncharacterized protein PRCAT00002876001 [Priceomyces carsonii]|uniref:uncharacterized protein n=1 Tax=Priceomyces carsonii TaxID=28549 RepID=UPI002EDB5697|nr:unnamed protein product [Priceomyces carsonii]
MKIQDFAMAGRANVILGIGVDIIKIGRFKHILVNKNDKYIERLTQRILHVDHELPQFKKLILSNELNKCANMLSGSWAAKEAVFKTLDHSDQIKFQFKEWYRSSDKHGKPSIFCDRYDKSDEEFMLSISHDNDMLIANAVRLQRK